MNAYAIRAPGPCFVSGKHISLAPNDADIRSKVRAVINARAPEQDAIRESHADECRTGMDSTCNFCDPSGFCNTTCQGATE